MKNNYKAMLGENEFKTVASKKMCETMTLIDTALDSSEEFGRNLLEKHLDECITDYANYVNNNENININEFNLYLNRFFSLYVLMYDVSSQEIRETLYNNLQVPMILQMLDINQIRFNDLFHKFEISLFSNAKFFKCKRLRG